MKHADVEVDYDGATYLVRPLTQWARVWMDENVQSLDSQWFAGALAVDPYKIGNLCDDMTQSGLRVTA